MASSSSDLKVSISLPAPGSCPTCGAPADSSTPGPLQYGFCGECGEILVSQDGRARIATDEDLKQVSPRTLSQVRRFSSEVKAKKQRLLPS